jgi:hypothetical protein
VASGLFENVSKPPHFVGTNGETVAAKARFEPISANGDIGFGAGRNISMRGNRTPGGGSRLQLLRLALLQP